MAIRNRVVVALSLVVLLSLSLAAAGKKVSAATAAAQIAVADVLYEHADFRAAMQVYMAATDCENVALRDRARAGTVRSALRLSEWGVAVSQLASLPTGAGDPATLALAGDALWAAGRFDEAEKAYRDAASVEPGNPRARHGIARSLASQNQMVAALEELQAAMRTAPADLELLLTQASILERMHRYQEAASAYLAYLGQAKGLDRPGRIDRVRWARNHVAFLRSFDGTVPFEIGSPASIKQHVLDFRLVGGKIMVKGKINGKKNVDFALDTGSEQTALSEKTARKLNVPFFTETMSAGVGESGIRDLRMARLRSLELGSLKVYNVPILVKSPSSRDIPVDNTDGFSPLAIGLSLSVDYKNRKLTLGEPMPPQPGARELPLRLNRLASVQVAVNGNPSSFIVDTGGEAISLNTSMARSLFTPKDQRRIKMRVYGASGLDPEAYLLPGVNLGFGPMTLSNQPVVVLDLRAPSVLLGYEIGGILGYRVLGKYRVDIDLQKSMLRLGDL